MSRPRPHRPGPRRRPRAARNPAGGAGRPAATARRGLTAAVLGAALLIAGTGCAQSVDPIERLGKKAAQGVGSHAAAQPAYRRWGLGRPLAPAPSPSRAPAASSAPARADGADGAPHEAPTAPDGDTAAPSGGTADASGATADASGSTAGTSGSTADASGSGAASAKDSASGPVPKDSGPRPVPKGAAPRPAPADSPPGSPLPPVVDHVDTTDKVVFLTYDDAAERDPRFVDMVRELRLPVSLFLTDDVVGPGYGHFAALRSVGAAIQNHTLDHPALRGLPYLGQRAEICGQQEKLKSRFGLRPDLLRPPYGRYDHDTLRAAADCGISAVVLWRATMGTGALTYAHGEHRLRPGDIVAVDPDESTTEPLTRRTTRLLRAVQDQGLTVGRLEDYLK